MSKNFLNSENESVNDSLANATFSSLPAMSALSGTESFPGLQGGANALGSVFQINAYVGNNVIISEGQVTNLVSDLTSLVNGLASKLNLSGGTLTGPLTLNADPTSNLQAATKHYVDNSVISIIGTPGNIPEYNVSGNTLTDSGIAASNIVLNNGSTYNINISGNAATSTQVYTQLGAANSTNYLTFFPSNAGNIYQTPLVNTFITVNPSNGLLNSPQLMVGEPFSPINCNVKSFINGTNASGTDGPGLGFFTDADSYPLLQISPFTHGNVLINFDCYSYNGNYYSSSAGSNFQIAKSNTQLQFNFRSGISPGSTFGFQPLGYFDSSGNLTLVGKLFMGNPSGSTNALVQFNTHQYGILPPVLNNSFEATLLGLLGSIDTGLQWFNSSTLTNNYWNGSALQQILTIQNLNAGSNVTLDKSVPGQITINVSGAGPALPGNLPEFNSSGNELIDSGVPAYSLFVWELVTGTIQQMAMNTGYIVKSSSPVTFILPPTNSTIGAMEIVGTGTASWTITLNSGQFIEYNGLTTTTSTGSVSSGTSNDSARLIYAGDGSGEFNIELSNGMQLTLS